MEKRCDSQIIGLVSGGLASSREQPGPRAGAWTTASPGVTARGQCEGEPPGPGALSGPASPGWTLGWRFDSNSLTLYSESGISDGRVQHPLDGQDGHAPEWKAGPFKNRCAVGLRQRLPMQVRSPVNVCTWPSAALLRDHCRRNCPRDSATHHNSLQNLSIVPSLVLSYIGLGCCLTQKGIQLLSWLLGSSRPRPALCIPGSSPLPSRGSRQPCPPRPSSPAPLSSQCPF